MRVEGFSIIRWFDRLFFALTVMAGPWVAPLANGIIFGWALASGFGESMGDLARVAGVAAGVGVVVAGAISSHVVMRSQEIDGEAPMRLWALVFGYIGLEILGLILMAAAWNITAVGIVVALMTLVVYLARSALISFDERLQKAEVGQQEAQQEAAEERAYQRKRQEAEDMHKRHLEELELTQNYDLKLARVKAKSAQVTSAQIDHLPSAQTGQVVSGQTEQALTSAQITQVLKYFSQRETGTKSGLAQNLGIARGTASKRIDQLTDHGLLTRAGSKWSISAQGQRTIFEHSGQNGKA